MIKSETITELAKALSTFQGALKPAKKDEVNPFFKMKYADLSSVWEVIREPLSKNGLSVTQLSIVDWKDRHYLETVLLHTSGEWVSSLYPIISTKPDPQSVGSALTYARRYSLSAILGVSAEDDDGEKAVEHKENVSSKPDKPITPQQLYETAITKETGASLCNFAMKNGYTIEKIKATLGIKSSSDIKDVKAAAIVLFPKGGVDSLVKEALKLGATEIEKGGETK